MTGKRQPLDKTFLVLVLVELFFGFVMLTSASGPLAYNRFNSSWAYALHQLEVGIIPGLVGMWFFSRFDYRRLARLATPAMIVALMLLVMVFIPGIAANFGTAHSWIMVGNFFSFQPTEFAKLALVLYVAALAGKSGREPKTMFVPSLLAFIVVSVLLALQPDMGSLLILAGLFMAMIFAAGVPVTYIFALAAAGGTAFYLFAKSAAYRVARLTVFLHPELDPQGIGYQINQAFLAIGSGGLFGLGLGHSQQKYSSLPQVMNDSIFPVIAEELGLLFSLGLVVLIVAIFFRGLTIAKNTSDRFGKILVTGVVSWVAIQSFVNIGAMLGVFPLTGVPLPLVSYGGTSMAITLWTFGMVLSVSRGERS